MNAVASVPTPAPSERDQARDQARRWVDRVLPASVKISLTNIIRRDVIQDKGFYSGYAQFHKAEKLLIRIIDLFPYPSGLYLRDEAERRMRRIDASDGEGVAQLLISLLEEPDALLS